MKRIVSFLLALVLCVSFSVAARAEPKEPSEAQLVYAAEGGEEPTRVEETEWYYRVLDNYYLQKRLWSITYERWLTDWITIGHI